MEIVEFYCRLTDFVKKSFSSINFETDASVAVSLLIRLYSKYCQSLSGDGMNVARQLERTEVLLQQNRPAKVLSDLLALYTSCYSFRRKGEWKNVILWSVSLLANEGVSIFIRRQISDFLCLTKDSEDVQLFLLTVVELFSRTDSTHVRNDAARVLMHFADQLSGDQIRVIMTTVQSIIMAGDVVYGLAAKVRPDMKLVGDLSPSKWMDESARCQLIIKHLQQSTRRNDVDDLLASVFLSPCMKLGWFVDVIELLDDKALREYLPGVHQILMDRRRSPLSDLQLMLSKLSARLTLGEISMVLDHCFSRLLESPSLIEAVCKVYGADCLNHAAMAVIRDRLAVEVHKAISHSDWEVRDTAVEIAVIAPFFRPMLGSLTQLVRFDPSPYVRAAALRCFVLDAKCHEKELPQLCEDVIVSDSDAEPRLVAMRYLHGTLPSNIQTVLHILPKAIEDSDDEVRKLMVEMCSSLLATKEYATDTAAELQEWIEDPEIGAAVRTVLGESPFEQRNPVEHILTDMMNALRLHFSDTIDCY
uniref:Adaptin_N domain-containing protein n=1 Tax=Angiostrongylus cantonensis TaxID=6313 RepID=A0A0K0CVW9_ANGCA